MRGSIVVANGDGSVGRDVGVAHIVEVFVIHVKCPGARQDSDVCRAVVVEGNRDVMIHRGGSTNIRTEVNARVGHGPVEVVAHYDGEVTGGAFCNIRDVLNVRTIGHGAVNLNVRHEVLLGSVAWIDGKLPIAGNHTDAEGTIAVGTYHTAQPWPAAVAHSFNIHAGDGIALGIHHPAIEVGGECGGIEISAEGLVGGGAKIYTRRFKVALYAKEIITAFQFFKLPGQHSHGIVAVGVG